MPRYGRTTAAVIPPPSTDQNDKKFLDPESQKMVDKIRKERTVAFNAARSPKYNPKVDQQRIWSERSPQAYKIPYESLGRESHLEHPQLKEKKPLKKLEKK